MLDVAVRAGRWAGRAALVASIIAFALLAIGPRTGRYRTLTVLTASMRPNVAPGSVVVTVPVRIEDLAVGDVITYAVPVDDHRVITHRVVEIVEPGVVRTKGDANDSADPWLANLQGGTAWRMRGAIPGVGYAIQTMSLPIARVATVFVSLGAAVILGLRSIWRRPSLA